MAELLVKAVDAIHPDPDKDARGCYKRGDPVVVQEDGHVWGAREGLPRFVIIKIPGVPADRLRAFLEPDEAVDEFSGERLPRIRRRWRALVDDLPAQFKRSLRDTGTVTVTWTQVRSYVQDKATLATAPETL